MRHYVFGGRYGDICHSLTAVHEYYRRTGNRVRFTAASEFAGILDGCSWIDPIAAPVPWANINDIVAHSKALYPDDDYVVMACYGINYSPGYRNHSFLRDSWRLSQCPEPPETQPLVFDRRDPAREEVLIKSHLSNVSQNGFIAVCTSGKSSPFPSSHLLVDDIRKACPGMDVLDVGSIRAHRVYDILAILERARALVTIDTLHLHMSAAVPELPVLALICDGPALWNRSDWRPQQVWRATYSEYPNLRQSFRQTLAAHAKDHTRLVS